jgi:N-acetylmuramoyl-L-alanine amidase
MPYHQVQQGEWMGSIAAQYGFALWRPIWKLAENADLRSKRTDPELLFPGDLVWIPEVKQNFVARPTDSPHKFTRLNDRAKLRLRIVDVDRFIRAFGPIPYLLEMEDGSTQSGEISREGQEIEVDLSLRAEKGTLQMRGVEPILIGGLDPLNTVSGMQGRLQNLGFDPGPIDNIAGPLTASAVREFQQRNAIQVDGIIGPETRGKMKEVYGC